MRSARAFRPPGRCRADVFRITAVEFVDHFWLRWNEWALVSLATARAIRVSPQPGWAVQKNALGGVDAQSFKDFGVFQGQFDHLADAPDLPMQAADLLGGEAHGFALFCPFVLEIDLGAFAHHDHALGRNAGDPVIQRARANQIHACTITGDQGSALPANDRYTGRGLGHGTCGHR